MDLETLWRTTEHDRFCLRRHPDNRSTNTAPVFPPLDRAKRLQGVPFGKIRQWQIHSANCIRPGFVVVS